MVTVEFCALRLHTCVCRWGEGGDTFPSTSFAPNTLAVRCFDSGVGSFSILSEGAGPKDPPKNSDKGEALAAVGASVIRHKRPHRDAPRCL